MLTIASFTLFALMTHSNGLEDYFVVDYDLSESECLAAAEDLQVVMAENVVLFCE